MSAEKISSTGETYFCFGKESTGITDYHCCYLNISLEVTPSAEVNALERYEPTGNCIGNVVIVLA